MATTKKASYVVISDCFSFFRSKFKLNWGRRWNFSRIPQFSPRRHPIRFRLQININFIRKSIFRVIIRWAQHKIQLVAWDQTPEKSLFFFFAYPPYLLTVLLCKKRIFSHWPKCGAQTSARTVSTLCASCRPSKHPRAAPAALKYPLRPPNPVNSPDFAPFWPKFNRLIRRTRCLVAACQKFVVNFWCWVGGVVAVDVRWRWRIFTMRSLRGCCSWPRR